MKAFSAVRIVRLLVVIGVTMGASLRAVEAGGARTEIVIVVGPGAHAPGSHEEGAGARLVQYGLEHATNVSGLHVRVFTEWPADEGALHAAQTIVFIGDTFPPARFPDTARIMAKLEAMMKRGCGIVAIHYGSGLRGTDVAENNDHPLLHWLGGYFATATERHRSIARIMPVTVTPASGPSPILRGWREFSITDEPYYNLVFDIPGSFSRITPLATGMIPPEKPRRETLAWSLEREDGGRGFGVVIPHYFRNWAVDDLRKLVLNGIVWSAKREVPIEGVASVLPELGSFQPKSVNPAPKPAVPVPTEPASEKP